MKLSPVDVKDRYRRAFQFWPELVICVFVVAFLIAAWMLR